MMKYTIEFMVGFNVIEQEIEGRIPNKGELVKVSNAFYVVDEILTDLSYSEPIYEVRLRSYFEN